MIPRGIDEAHILRAADRIDRDGVPLNRQADRYDLMLRGKQYPPQVRCFDRQFLRYGRGTSAL